MKQEENVCAKCACFRAKGLRCKNQPLGITHPETESCSRFEEKCCGNCCWFYAEDTYGFGACPFQFAEVRQCDRPCNSEENFVSKEEMRHHMYVMLRTKYWFEGVHWHVLNPHEMHEAYSFAYKYMKVFSKL